MSGLAIALTITGLGLAVLLLACALSDARTHARRQEHRADMAYLALLDERIKTQEWAAVAVTKERELEALDAALNDMKAQRDHARKMAARTFPASERD